MLTASADDSHDRLTYLSVPTANFQHSDLYRLVVAVEMAASRTQTATCGPVADCKSSRMGFRSQIFITIVRVLLCDSCSI